MPLLSFELSLTIGIAAAIFALGLTAWLHNKWSRGNVLFALLSFCFAFWLTIDWFAVMQNGALPEQLTVWRIIFYLTVSFSPALALHAAIVASRRHLPIRSWICYPVSLFLFGVIDTAFLLSSVFPASDVGSRLLEGCSLFGVFYYSITLLAVAVQLYPIVYSRLTDYLERRRAVYALLLLSLFLMAGLAQFLSIPVPVGLMLAALGAGYFLLASMAFIRSGLLNVKVPPIEIFTLTLLAAGIVYIFHSETPIEAGASLLILLVVGSFGLLAVRSVHIESKKNLQLERRMCELERLDTARCESISMITHQLRGPIGCIRVASDAILNGDCGKYSIEVEPVIRQIKQSADRLLALAETSLNAARLEAGAFHSTRSSVDTVSVIREIIAELTPLANAKRIGLRSSFTGVPKELLLDREVLHNVVFNLVDNAIKFTDDGSVMLVAFLRDGALTITVSDSGAGLTQKDLSQIFKQFHRGRFVHDRQHDGAGIGLFVVKRLMENVGGRVSVISDGPGKGASFTVEFPLADKS